MNQLSSPAVESRLGDGVVSPMRELHRSGMPSAANRLDELSQGGGVDVMRAARAAQQAVIDEMRRILSNLLEWQGFQEAVALLREVLKMQGQVSEETEKRIEREIFGAEPEDPPSND